MAKKKDTEEDIKLLKSKILERKAIIGAERVLKGLRSGTLQKIFIASNCPEKVKADIRHYAELNAVLVTELKHNNEELGILCKKNFMVAVLGLIKE